jgi:hypothetical protein
MIKFTVDIFMILSSVLQSIAEQHLSSVVLRRWPLSALLLTVGLVGCNEISTTGNGDVELGRRIYMEGILASGKPLQGKRMDVVQVEGVSAACESCHRRSGMGSLEGNIVVPPITGRFLFATDEDRPIALVDARAAKNVTRAHKPYDGASFAKAISEGVNMDGKALNPLMPKYDLTNQEMKAVLAYLRQLSAEVSPGVGEDSVHFATIVTPEVTEQEKSVLQQMLQTAFSQRNASQENYSGRMRMPLDLIPRTQRNWDLAVWELKGDPDTWYAQLAEFYSQQPVFAVVSGISHTTWEPVHAFCQQEKLPCMLPSIPLVPDMVDFYSLYYTRGVALEADVLAKYLRGLGEKMPSRVVQIYRDDEVGRAASQALSAALNNSGISVENRSLSGREGTDFTGALKDISANDVAMLWLNQDDLATLSQALPGQPATTVYLSGILANEDYGFVPKDWQPQLKVVYPYELKSIEHQAANPREYELGVSREANTATLKAWLKTWQIPLVNEAMQAEVFFNLLFLTDLSSQMLDNLYRDYMIERAEDMLSFGSNISAYPHLSLSRGQRYASKGAYIAHVEADGKLIADSEWIVP